MQPLEVTASAGRRRAVVTADGVELVSAARGLGPAAVMDHLNDRPGWNCTACGESWPCETARERLLEEFRAFPTTLTIYLSAQMYDALGDLVAEGQIVPGNLFERFVAWARKAAVAPRGDDEGGPAPEIGS
ncbi:hypothetical protein M1L60_15015 [Actinoplanes sp. TRM 88003]|uniref:Uncharacterized protein n=1 Tax=Paractinoplanes aksuensis TaxID=2939490 RepID=A0ABT1DM66_9ACTN|nr:hypothetical protein [Actinoplanes aksuensis]MCO8271904.1 hypothetical protein [Actinoplanes aksuensis]